MKKPDFAKPGRKADKPSGRLMALLGLAACLLRSAGSGADLSLTEYQVKSLFLLNFTKYVDWPAGAFADTNAPVTIGVYGENRFGDDLRKAVAGKTAGGRGIALRQIEKTEDLGKCHILFISSSEKKRMAEILSQVKSLPVLTVGETDQFIDQGGIINFTMKENKVRLEINLQSAREANLQVSSKLLSVADSVKGRSK